MKIKINKKSVIYKILMLGILSLCFSNISSAAEVNSSSTISINVQVAEKTMVAIHPASLSWTGSEAQNPGTAENVTKAIQIENIGSTNITYVWLNTTYPSDSPFGSGDPLQYDAGNFVVMRKNESNALFYYVQRMEYNESELIYLTLPSGADTHGRFRNGNAEYFWSLEEDATSGDCTNGTFSIGTNPHNETMDGTVDLSSCTPSLTGTAGNIECRTGSLTQAHTGAPGDNWSYASVVVDNCSKTCWNYTVAVNEDCSKILFYHWNMDAWGAGSSGYPFVEYLRNETLYPGGNFIANVGIRVPYGTAAGTMTQGTLTVVVQATES